MKYNHLTLIAVGALFSLYSCAPVYTCGEERPEGGIQGNNRLLAVVEERDLLCEELATKAEESEYLIRNNQSLKLANDELTEENIRLESEKETLATDLKDLKEKHVDLTERLSSSLTEKINMGHLYDQRIKDKEQRLAEKEAALFERERKIKELESEIARQDSIAKRLNSLLREALLGFDSDELTIEIKDGKVYVSMSDKLMFQSGKAEVQSKGKEALKLLGKVLKKNDEFHILIEGHTDNVPIKTAKYQDNWDLSVARATSMVRILLNDHDIEPNRLTASGKGEFEPRASNDTPEGRAQNRRTEIILSPDLSELMEFIGN